MQVSFRGKYPLFFSYNKHPLNTVDGVTRVVENATVRGEIDEDGHFLFPSA